jgi:hypothetical protein
VVENLPLVWRGETQHVWEAVPLNVDPLVDTFGQMRRYKTAGLEVQIHGLIAGLKTFLKNLNFGKSHQCEGTRFILQCKNLAALSLLFE